MILSEADTLLAPVTEIDGFVLACLVDASTGMVLASRQASDGMSLPAVAAGRVFLAPSLPFGFIDAPPSLNRLIGLTWLLHTFYPEQAPGKLREQVRSFYHLFYQVDLTEPDIDTLLGSSGG